MKIKPHRNDIVIRLLTFLILVASAMPATQAYTSADFNRIKLDQAYLYAESTLESEESSCQTARVLLINYVNRYFRENGIDRSLTPESDIDIKYMTMPRGNKTRAMAFIAKADLNGPAKPSAKSITAPGDEGAPQIPEWQSEIIGQLKEAGNLGDATKVLRDNKAIYKIKNYGTIKECLNARTCFWVICNQSLEVTAILGNDTGEDRRYNYVTGKYDSLSNYSAQYGAWFQFR